MLPHVNSALLVLSQNSRFSFHSSHHLLILFPFLMDDLAHESTQFHSISRKRKADTDDCSVQDPSVNVTSDHSAPPDPNILLDPSATPRGGPTSTQDPSASRVAAAAWMIPHRDRQPWRPSSPATAASISCTALTCKEGPSEPKRQRVEAPPTTTLLSTRRIRRTRSAAYGCVSSPRRYYRGAALPPGETRDTGIVTISDPGPSKGSLLRVSTVPAVPRPSRSLPASPVEPLSPHIPSNQPPINKETLKELDLDAILRNPQLRMYHSIYHSAVRLDS